jgi:hypothetical protein
MQEHWRFAVPPAESAGGIDLEFVLAAAVVTLLGAALVAIPVKALVWLARRNPSHCPASSGRWPLDTIVCRLSKTDALRLSDVCEGVVVFGATGSGKTSGPGEMLARSLLRLGCGGLVMAAKPDEVQTWLRYARETAREQDVILFGSAPGQAHRFNPLLHEQTRPGPGAGETFNMVNLLMEVVQAANQGRDNRGGGEQDFWLNASERLLRAAIDVLKHSLGEVTVPLISKLIAWAPMTRDMADDPEWRKVSPLYQCLQKGAERIARGELSGTAAADFKSADRYFMVEYPAIPDRMQGSIAETLRVTLDKLCHGSIGELIGGSCTFTPEQAMADRRIVLLTDSIKEHGDAGRLVQITVKSAFQRSAERRARGDDVPPLFVWSDEDHLFTVPRDQVFATTSRASRAISVCLTQSVSNYLSALGADSKATVDALLACRQIKVFCQNTDPATNQYAAELIGKSWQSIATMGETETEEDRIKQMFFVPTNRTSSASFTSQLHYTLEPNFFTTLKKGGYAFNGMVEAIVFNGGRLFNASRASFLLTEFRQHAFQRLRTGR